ncbi:unnamed protein product [Brachionus calyciflorus]|uniref:TIR domain-containing protein n=1 Tax=Brachionus calyciflorus TaxID=104777 RepID=A0A814PKE8_9BILA|nr:unnamed protein product [Brachionus calyciflorus]
MDYKNDIFISYNWDIKPDVKNLYSILNGNGYRVWMDEKSMVTGHNLTNEIAEAIIESRMIICCLTIKYSKSEMCQREINFANDCKRKQPDKIILPILFEKVQLNDLGGVGFLVSNLLYIKYEKNADWEHRIIDHITQLIKTKKQPKENSRKIEKNISEYEFREAVLNDEIDIVRDYVENYGNVNIEDTYGTTSLHDAIANGNLIMLKLLISNNGDVFKRDNLGQTILHWGIFDESGR